MNIVYYLYITFIFKFIKEFCYSVIYDICLNFMIIDHTV